MSTHSTTLAWRITWTEEPGGLQLMGFQRVRHNWATSLSFFLSVGKGRVNATVPHTLTWGHSPTPYRAWDPKAEVTRSFKAMKIRWKALSASCFCVSLCVSTVERSCLLAWSSQVHFFMNQKIADILCLIPSPYFSLVRRPALSLRERCDISLENLEGLLFLMCLSQMEDSLCTHCSNYPKVHAHIHLHRECWPNANCVWRMCKVFGVHINNVKYKLCS